MNGKIVTIQFRDSRDVHNTVSMLVDEINVAHIVGCDCNSNPHVIKIEHLLSMEVWTDKDQTERFHRALHVSKLEQRMCVMARHLAEEVYNHTSSVHEGESMFNDIVEQAKHYLQMFPKKG